MLLRLYSGTTNVSLITRVNRPLVQPVDLPILGASAHHWSTGWRGKPHPQTGTLSSDVPGTMMSYRSNVIMPGTMLSYHLDFGQMRVKFYGKNYRVLPLNQSINAQCPSMMTSFPHNIIMPETSLYNISVDPPSPRSPPPTPHWHTKEAWQSYSL